MTAQEARKQAQENKVKLDEVSFRNAVQSAMRGIQDGVKRGVFKYLMDLRLVMNLSFDKKREFVKYFEQMGYEVKSDCTVISWS